MLQKLRFQSHIEIIYSFHTPDSTETNRCKGLLGGGGVGGGICGEIFSPSKITLPLHRFLENFLKKIFPPDINSIAPPSPESTGMFCDQFRSQSWVVNLTVCWELLNRINAHS